MSLLAARFCSPLRPFARELAFLAVATVACAVRAYLYFQTDEHFSVIEFASLRLGWSLPDQLPWEYPARIRPWLQPAIYLRVLQLGRALGIEGRFAFVALLRLVTGMVGVASYAALVVWTSRPAALVLGARRPPEPVDVASRRRLLRHALLLTFLPYLFTRTSAEALSGALLALAWVAWFPAQGTVLGGRSLTARCGLFAGLLAGFAFDVRPQTALFTLGLVAWTLAIGRRSLRWWGGLAIGGAAALALLVFADRWGYGEWVFSPWRYFVVNILEGRAASYGTAPSYAYTYLLLENAFAPLAIYAVIVVTLALVRNPRHPMSWAVGMFALAHVVLAHKEDRFLFPMAPMLAVLVPLALRPPRAPRAARWLGRVAAYGRVANVLGAVALAAMLVHAYGNCNLGVVRAVEMLADRGAPVVVVAPLERPFTREPFYERIPWLAMTPAEALPESLRAAPCAYVVAYDELRATSTCPAPSMRGTCTRIWSELPLSPADGRTHDEWLTRVEGLQEVLRMRFSPRRAPHPTFYAVYRYEPAR